jgi:hypothetical protein
MPADHVEQYHWVAKSRPAVKARWRLGVEAWIVERRHPCYPIGRVRQPLLGPWLVICRFDRLLTASALCLHLNVANQLLKCRDGPDGRPATCRLRRQQTTFVST